MPVDYVAIGPIFSTTTKQSANPPVGLDGLARVREALGAMPLVAIGGITSENIGTVIKAGADVVAVISDIWVPAKGSLIRMKRFLNYA
jgi:thiamine-phosphate pyrophosphorylase